MSAPDPLSRVAVALDTDDWALFESWCRRFGGRVGALKVGLEAFIRFGSRAADEVLDSGARLFLDLKLHDIPNTVSGAVRAAAGQGASWVTVHAAGGRRMLEAASEAAAGDVSILAVTVLTHLDGADLSEMDWPGAVEPRVARWAGIAREAGCQGVVCSPAELGRLRPALPAPFQLVTPGIRPRGSSRDDQRRVATPGEALAAGADLLVVGRPLTRAEDPVRALDDLEAELLEPPGTARR